MAKIILYKGQSNYGSLRLHIDQLGAALLQLGHEVIIIDLIEEDCLSKLNKALNKNPDFVLAFNGMGIDLVSDGKSIYDLVNVPFIAAMVDHPHFHIERLKTSMNQLYVTCLDRSHLAFLKSFFPANHIKSSMFWVPGGNRNMNKKVPNHGLEDFIQRDICILFTGSFRGIPNREWRNYAESIKTLLDDVTDTVLSADMLSFEDALSQVLKGSKMELSNIQGKKLHLLMPLVNSYVHATRRYNFLNKLSEHNINVEVYGQGWDMMKSKWHSFTFKDEGSFEDTLNNLQQTKLVLNTNTHFIDGGHERIFAAMLNGAAVLTDTSKYYMEEFTDQEEILFYNWDHLDDAPQLIQKYMDYPELLWKIASNGQKKVLENHTWRSRAEQLIDFIELNKLLYNIEGV